MPVVDVNNVDVEDGTTVEVAIVFDKFENATAKERVTVAVVLIIDPLTIIDPVAVVVDVVFDEIGDDVRSGNRRSANPGDAAFVSDRRVKRQPEDRGRLLAFMVEKPLANATIIRRDNRYVKSLLVKGFG